jgi:serine O-acetyltransferase
VKFNEAADAAKRASASASVCAMSSRSAETPSFRELLFSDFARYRAVPNPRWLAVLMVSLTDPGMLASLIIRAQQCLHFSGHRRLAIILRMIANTVLGADFGPGMTIGKGLWIPHPAGVTVGIGAVIGDNVTLAGGATVAARYYDPKPGVEQEFATICDNAVIGAHAVLVGGVRIGVGATVGANSVVLSDVPDGAVVLGNPARPVGNRAGAKPPAKDPAHQGDS